MGVNSVVTNSPWGETGVNLVKLVYGSTQLLPCGSTATLTMLWLKTKQGRLLRNWRLFVKWNYIHWKALHNYAVKRVDRVRVGWVGVCVCVYVCGWGCWNWKPVHGDGMDIKFWAKSQKKSSGASHVLFCNLHVMQHQSVWSLTWGLLEKECAQSSKLFIPDHYCCRRFLWTLKHFLQQKTTLVV